jgi:hypothetical protein
VTTPGIVFHGVVLLAKEERFATVRSAVADIVQCGLVTRNPLLLRGLKDAMEAVACKQLISWTLGSWLAALDDFRNWLIREAA